MNNIITIIFTCFVGYCHGQSLNTVFKPISLDQGHINNIMRDSEGFIWISTQDGLTKYNGTNFIQYNYDRKDTNSIANNYIWKTFEDNRGNIWVGLFEGGLCRFDKTKDKFYRYNKYGNVSKNGIRTFGQLNDSTLIVGSDHGLYLFDLNSFAYYSDTTFLKNQFNVGLYHSHSMEVIGDDIIIAGENGGYLLSPHTKKVEKIDTQRLGIGKIEFIKKLNKSTYLITDKFKFLAATYDVTTRQFQIEQVFISTSSITLNDISHTIEDEILLVAEEGLFILNFNLQTLLPISSESPNKNNLNDKVTFCIETIEPDLKWIGTKTQIYEFSEKKNAFYHIYSDSLCGSAILGLTEDTIGNLWVATRRGIGRIKNFNKPENEWKYYCYNKTTNPEIKNEYVLNIKKIKDLIFVGYRKKGFSILHLDTENTISLQNPPTNVQNLTKDASVSNFFLDSNNQVWISTSGNGVIKWSIENSEVKQYKNKEGQNNILSHNYTFGFEEIDSNWIAVATASGISVIHKIKDSTYQIKSGKDSLSLSGNFIMDFHRSPNDQLWVCTDGGLNMWNNDNTFKSWTKNEGLPNDVIYGMLDYEDELWISSNKGLVRFQESMKPSFKSFSKKDDVLNEEHNQFSFYKSKDNKLLFGGKSGITMFDPKKIIPNSTSAIPVIESFQLFNKNGKSRLKHHINYTNELVLDHNENFLSFDLASLSYTKPDQNKYRYLLSPLNEEWIELENRNFITLNGLAPGKYRLAIQASNNDGIWGNQTKTLNIFIRRPIFTRWYAWLFYFSIIAGIIYTFYKMKINHLTNLSKVREEERTKIRERSARDFHDEVGSLITKLSLLNQYLLSNTSKEAEENIGILNKMQTNIQRIRTGMKDFIWVLDPSKDALSSAIIKIREIGNDLFEHSEIKFICNIHSEVDKSSELNGVQRRQLILMIKEVLHNVLKHSKAKLCSLDITQSNQYLYFIIKDDGVGFDINSNSAGYGLKSIKERARKMEGSVTTISKAEMGTQTTIVIPTYPNGL